MGKSCETGMYCGPLSCFLKGLFSVKGRTEDELSTVLNRCNSCTTKTESRIAPSTRSQVGFGWVEKYTERTRSRN